MNLSERIEAFAKLSEYLYESLHEVRETSFSTSIPGEKLYSNPELLGVTEKAREVNPWFIPGFSHYALVETAEILKRENLEKWCVMYEPSGLHPQEPKVIGSILAGNVPLVGFHDFLSILISGNRFKGKISGKDDKLLPFLADRLISIEPRFAGFIEFTDAYLGSIDAIIATGSNNSSRYFEYYFGKYPHIFRKNRNGIAILTGNESEKELGALADDVLLYFGMGCRNVAKLYVPREYRFDDMFGAMEKYHEIFDHHKYANNYLYQRSVYLMNMVKHLDNGFLLLREDPVFSSPVSTLHYETYSSTDNLVTGIQDNADRIQCIAGQKIPGLNTIAFGDTQHPGLIDYADGVDTLKFLINL